MRLAGRKICSQCSTPSKALNTQRPCTKSPYLLPLTISNSQIIIVTPEVAKKFVITHIDSDKVPSVQGDAEKLTPSQKRNDLDELDACIEVLGGRLTDLEFFARRLKTGQTPNRAVAEIIDQRYVSIFQPK